MNSRLPRAAAILVSLVALTLACATTSEASPSSDREAQRHYQAALDLLRAKRLDEAYARLLASAAASPRPAVTLLLAQTALDTGRPRHALTHFDLWEEQAPDAQADVRAKVASARKRAEAELGRVRVHGAHDQPVTIDDRTPTPATDAGMLVEPGSHRVSVTRDARQIVVQVDVAKGQTVDVDLPPAEHTQAPAANSRGEATAAVPARTNDAPALPLTTTAPIWIAGSISVAGLATAVVLGSMRVNAEHSVDVSRTAITRGGGSPDACGGPSSGAQFASACRTIARGQATLDDTTGPFAISLAAGAVGVVAAAGWYLWGPRSAERGPLGRARVTPIVGIDVRGAQVEGSF